MQSKSLLTILLLFTALCGVAQQPYYNQRPEFLKANSHWAFGDHAGLDFSSGSPVDFPTAIYADEGCTAVSDPVTGAFLFYSNGEQCWNAAHQVMPNGDSLKGNSRYSSYQGAAAFPGYCASSSQGVVIAPVIGSPGKYYLFSLVGSTVPDRNMTDGALFYNIIDMNLDGGMGDIETAYKNITLTHDTLGEAIATVPGNNCDIWLLVLPTYLSELWAYHIDANGIDTVPVISNLGGGSYFSSFCSITPSPDRSKLAIMSGPSGFLGEFDPNTGQLSNMIYLNSWRRGAGVAFSPDNSKLYLGGFDHIVQYDISIYTGPAINASIQQIPITGSITYNSFRLYNDTIYFAKTIGATSTDSNKIHRINAPNLAGLACDLEENAISVTMGPMMSILKGIPGNDVVLPIPYDTIYTVKDSLLCLLDHTAITLQPTISSPELNYLWNTGATSSEIIISSEDAGVYWVSYGAGCAHYVDTFKVVADNVFTAITVDVFELGTIGGPFSSYQWMLNGAVLPGAVASTYDVLENGDYQVIVTSEHGCVDTSDVYTVTNHTGIEDPGMASQIRVYPNPAREVIFVNGPVKVNVSIRDVAGRLIKEQPEAKAIPVDDLAPGIYLLHISDKNGTLLKVEKLVME
jgi:hypothetical protein